MHSSETMAKKCKPETDERVYEMQATICKAFANPTRLRILDLCSQGEQSASALQDASGISATNMSQHLAILKAAGVVASRREGKQVFYSLAIPQVKQACGLIRDVLRVRLAKGRELVV
jgi:DNA-binding transcriptional ArsR family regulator